MNVSTECPVCQTYGPFMRAPLTKEQIRRAGPESAHEDSPYVECHGCGLWFQLDPPPFQYEADDDRERKALVLSEAPHHEALAQRLHEAYKPTSVLDVGSSYPYFLSRLKALPGVEKAVCCEGSPDAQQYADELGVEVVVGNFLEKDLDGPFDLITMVHVIEHFHDPSAALRRARSLLSPKGVLFLRTPLNNAAGLLRWHFTKGHFQVHPLLFEERSLRLACAWAGFVMVRREILDNVGHGDFDWMLNG